MALQAVKEIFSADIRPNESLSLRLVGDQHSALGGAEHQIAAIGRNAAVDNGAHLADRPRLADRKHVGRIDEKKAFQKLCDSARSEVSADQSLLNAMARDLISFQLSGMGRPWCWADSREGGTPGALWRRDNR